MGKSTLINALIGEKISIVTAKPQTTRHRILGVASGDNSQIVFVDTPGIHRNAGKAMNRLMNRTAASALADADVVLFVTDAARYTEEDEDVLDRVRQSGVPAIALLNKVDIVHPRDRILAALKAMAERHSFSELMPVSAKTGHNLERLVAVLPNYLPESPPLFPDEMRTDRSREFRAAETIREKLTLMLHEELPYGLTVQIERYERTDRNVEIDAIVWVERDSQKGIVVGKGGSRLKKIGRAARLDLKEQLGIPVHLELWVKVRENWANSDKDLQTLGFDPV